MSHYATPLTQIHATDLASGEAPPSPEGSAHFVHPRSEIWFAAFVADANVIIAHNADFDRKIWRRSTARLQTRAWAVHHGYAALPKVGSRCS